MQSFFSTNALEMLIKLNCTRIIFTCYVDKAEVEYMFDLDWQVRRAPVQTDMKHIKRIDTHRVADIFFLLSLFHFTDKSDWIKIGIKMESKKKKEKEKEKIKNKNKRI